MRSETIFILVLCVFVLSLVFCGVTGYVGLYYVNDQKAAEATALAAKPTLSKYSMRTPEPYVAPTPTPKLSAAPTEVPEPEGNNLVEWDDLDPTTVDWLLPGIEYRMVADVYLTATDVGPGEGAPMIYLADAKVYAGAIDADVVVSLGRWDEPFEPGVTYDLRVVYWKRIDGALFFHVIDVVDRWETPGKEVPSGSSA